MGKPPARTLGCDKWDCMYRKYPNTSDWDPEKRSFCCSVSGMGCARDTPNLEGMIDCNEDYDDWENKWNDHTRSWCCKSTGRACGQFDCRTSSDEWAADKQDWCCKHEEKCPTTTTEFHDCTEDADKWEAEWSGAKKAYCCKAVGRACDAFDCGEGKPESWEPEKRGLCCQKYSVGCITTPPHNCDERFFTWEDSWDRDKKDYCCKHGLDEVCEIFKCSEKCPHWETHWSQEKKDYCCETQGEGCPETTAATTPPPVAPFDCAEDLDDWEDWESDKRTWCCANDPDAKVACERYDCTDAYSQDDWSGDKKMYCCVERQVGCDISTSFLVTFDCKDAADDWEAWSEHKKAYCCHTTGVACDRYDCDKDLEKAQDLWCVERRQWCCAFKNRGCDLPE